eukprot:PhF_6_TR26628/c0_g1_i2/m.38534
MDRLFQYVVEHDTEDDFFVVDDGNDLSANSAKESPNLVQQNFIIAAAWRDILCLVLAHQRWENKSVKYICKTTNAKYDKQVKLRDLLRKRKVFVLWSELRMKLKVIIPLWLRIFNRRRATVLLKIVLDAASSKWRVLIRYRQMMKGYKLTRKLLYSAIQHKMLFIARGIHAMNGIANEEELRRGGAPIRQTPSVVMTARKAYVVGVGGRVEKVLSVRTSAPIQVALAQSPSEDCHLLFHNKFKICEALYKEKKDQVMIAFWSYQREKALYESRMKAYERQEMRTRMMAAALVNFSQPVRSQSKHLLSKLRRIGSRTALKQQQEQGAKSMESSLVKPVAPVPPKLPSKPSSEEVASMFASALSLQSEQRKHMEAQCENTMLHLPGADVQGVKKTSWWRSVEESRRQELSFVHRWCNRKLKGCWKKNYVCLGVPDVVRKVKPLRTYSMTPEAINELLGTATIPETVNDS